VLVVTHRHLGAVCEGLAAAGAFALDTEFNQERTYRTRLGIVQVATPEIEAIIDPGAVGDLTPLIQLFADPTIQKVVHAGQNDFAVFYERSGVTPKNLFDSQLAAEFAGFGHAPSLKVLAKATVGVDLDKSVRRTDWTARPLTHEQLAYAIEDVRHLLPIRDVLTEKLSELGRWAWVEEEVAGLECEAAYRRRDGAEAYLRIRVSGERDPQFLGRLRALAAWRESIADADDVPPRFVLNDACVEALARRWPRRVAELTGVACLGSTKRREYGDAIVRALREGHATPVNPASDHDGDEASRIVRDAFIGRGIALVQSAAERLGLPAHRVAKTEDVRALYCARGTAGVDAVRVMRGWRRAVVGDALLADLSEGEASPNATASGAGDR